MQITDTIADLLTRIRNASTAKHESVLVPASKIKRAIVQILCDEGYIKNFSLVSDYKQGIIKIFLKYNETQKPIINGIKRISKPGLRIYSNSKNMPKVMRGLGVVIVSTSKGIMTDRNARKARVGGEVMAYVW